MTIYLIVGLPGAGKTTRAKELEASEPALRLTPDDWYRAVFHRDDPSHWRLAERVEQRDRLEGKLVQMGLRAAQLGVHVVLDLGLWGRDERSALRALAAERGVPAQVVYLPVDPEEQRRRITARSQSDRREFEISDADLWEWRAQFEVPDEEELHGHGPPPVPPAWPTWAAWAAERWPSSTDPRTC